MRTLPFLAGLLAIAGCSEAKVAPLDAAPEAVDSPTAQDSAPPEDTSAPDEHWAAADQVPKPGIVVRPNPTVTGEDAGGLDDPSGWLFSSEAVIPIDILMSEDSANALNADPYTYVEGDVVIDGMKVENVGIRLKGKIGSFRTLSQKAAFKIDLTTYVDDQSFYGIKEFNLNNSVVDCSFLKEHLSYQIFRDAGLPAERMGYAWVTVNGEPFGLYNILEQLDKPFLNENYDDPSGNLYDGKYLWYGGWSYTLLDFLTDVQDMYPLQEGTDVSNEDIGKVVAAIGSSSGTDAYYDTVGAVVDWDQVLEYFSAEQWAGQDDGYVLNTNNYFVYFNPTDGKMQMIPWDMDYSLLNDYDWGMNWAAPAGILASSCFQDATCRAAWGTRAGVLMDTIDEDALVTQAQAWAKLINPYAEVDPRQECSFGEDIDWQTAVYNWIKARRGYMTGYWGL